MANNHRGSFFHVFNKSIANFQIFGRPERSWRLLQTLDYYNSEIIAQRFSTALNRKIYKYQDLLIPKERGIVKFLSYCIMPDHYHLLIKLESDYPLSKYLSDVENSYTRYFNTIYKRKGPLYQGRVKTVRIKSDEQLLHVSRYVHLNPTSSNLVEKPEDWAFSSYKSLVENQDFLSLVLVEFSIKSRERYRSFVEDQISYQRELKKMRKMLKD